MDSSAFYIKIPIKGMPTEGKRRYISEFRHLWLGQGPSHHRDNFKRVIIEYSESKNFDEAIKEWSPRVVEIGEDEDQCICAHTIHILYSIVNMVNRNEVIVGCDCVEKCAEDTHLAQCIRDLKSQVNYIQRKIRAGEPLKSACITCGKFKVMDEGSRCKKCMTEGKTSQVCLLNIKDMVSNTISQSTPPIPQSTSPIPQSRRCKSCNKETIDSIYCNVCDLSERIYLKGVSKDDAKEAGLKHDQDKKSYYCYKTDIEPSIRRCTTCNADISSYKDYYAKCNSCYRKSSLPRRIYLNPSEEMIENRIDLDIWYDKEDHRWYYYKDKISPKLDEYLHKSCLDCKAFVKKNQIYCCSCQGGFITIGKYRGKRYREVFSTNRQYCKWVLEQENFRDSDFVDWLEQRVK